MEDAAVVRAGTREELQDVDPQALRDDVYDAIDESWLTPGVVTIQAARRCGADEVGPGLRRRAAGVQLIYEGLANTRGLVDIPPWTTATDGNSPNPDAVERGNMDVLVADVLVARGAHLLAYTEAADECVAVIQRFGRRQTDENVTSEDRTLEADALELAAIAGSTLDGPTPVDSVLAWANDLAASLDGGDLPETSSLLPAPEAGTTGQTAVANESRSGRSDP